MSYISISLALALVSLWILCHRLLANKTRCLIPGPPSKSLVFGHAVELAQTPVGTCYSAWERMYGPTYMLHGPFLQQRLVIGDPKGLQFVLSRKSFERNAADRAALELFFGRGMFSAEGDEHARMRKTLSGAFSAQSIQEVSHVFFELTDRLVNEWIQNIDTNPIFDISAAIQRLTLDAISMTMFSYDLTTAKSNIPILLQKITNSPPSGKLMILLESLAEKFPVMLNLPSPMKSWCNTLRKSLGVIAEDVWSGREGAGMHAKLLNVLSELGFQNLKEKADVPVTETIAQIVGILFAGTETSANVIVECLYELSKNQDMQNKLRTELVEFEAQKGRQPNIKDLTSTVALPYLDAITRETLRTKAVLTSISRDEYIPLQFPLKGVPPQADQYMVPVKAGMLIEIPVRDGVNVSERIWGNDAKIFNPERWLSPESTAVVNSPSHLLTFGDGPKICLGRIFATAEFKVVISGIIRRFRLHKEEGLEFDFYHMGGNTIKPMVRGQQDKGPQMPLKVNILD
ncbi:cytochrome P450 [Gymnopus androsaceus JB14]|uniref:Cytochrome P450 n=1 Tax=Gymnopus androsaceus JB14 TaxID=1447944 RepID=A0A6A4I9W1_9AGAR|nr:cytochrome P450 [Gymnopus androsaceus JB14]